MRLKKGFTLVELLVVISIIAILAAIGLAAYQSVYKAGRDAKRRSDLKIIQSALQQYHSDQKYYPAGSVTPGGQLTNATGAKPGTQQSRVYLNIPSDPQGSPNYSYQPSPVNCDNDSQNCTNYCLFARLENTQGVISDANCSPSGQYNFGVTRP